MDNLNKIFMNARSGYYTYTALKVKLAFKPHSLQCFKIRYLKIVLIHS